ncbi:cellulase family glycosylhydrolase [Paenibacillus athensensis]|uniref:Endoglucanase n=2 Tax=Paenibacillus athensensis TaxID=1967502 RepID=A0A4Y8PTU2_9BACL|nr:cellulase family glycosylhydrolase [Paenibacillus athensensis]MCD1261315.1 cellulase family glycosylhydrolase [Paenibacillus athensensis]
MAFRSILALLLTFSAVIPWLLAVPAAAATGGIVDQYGQLKVVGSQLQNQAGQAIQLKGMSSHGIQWYGNFVNKSSMQWLRDQWGLTVFRVAMYTAENGYISNPAANKAKVKEAVQAAIDLGVYVIIDWHILSDNDPNIYKAQSKAFFQEMATTYGSYPNVIYEIANEPNGGVTWSGQIKPYAQEIASAIRAIDPDNIIIVGTGTWSQDVQDAAASPLAINNVMYTVHFYAGTHGQYLRDRITSAMNSGIAVFVTEWGTSDASGNGGPYLTDAKTWTDFLASKKVSWANWSLSDKSESSAALLPGASTTGGWTDAQLSASGKFVRDQMKVGTTTPTVPAAPSGLSATAGNAQVALSWSPSAQATGYNVKRATASGGPYTTVAAGVSGTSYTNTGLTNGTTYYYVVSAVNSAGESANSSQVSAVPATSTTTPPPAGGLSVQYRVGDTSASDNQTKPYLSIVNQSGAPVNLSTLKLRYYYTADGKSQNVFCDYTPVNCANLIFAAVKAGTAKPSADAYIEIGFTAAAGQLANNASTGDIQLRMHNTDWSNMNESNDYSYDGTKTSSAAWTKVTLYSNGTRVWGIEP